MKIIETKLAPGAKRIQDYPAGIVVRFQDGRLYMVGRYGVYRGTRYGLRGWETPRTFMVDLETGAVIPVNRDSFTTAVSVDAVLQVQS